jgi:hypothetical protein
VPGRDFIAKALNGFWGGANPYQASFGYGPCKICIFCEETISGVNSITFGSFCNRDKFFNN